MNGIVLKMAFIGSGAIMQNLYLPASEKIKEIERAAIYGRNVTKLKNLASRFSISRIYTDWDRLIDESRPDIIAIALPPKFHFNAAKKALLNNAHIIIEKPAVINIEDGNTLLRIVKETDRIAVVNMTLRFLPIFRALKDIAEKYAAGFIEEAEIEYNVPRPPQKWYCDIDRAGGGASLIIGIHVVDLIYYLLKRRIQKIEFLSRKKRLFSKLESAAEFNVYFSENEKCKCSVSYLHKCFSAKLAIRSKNNKLGLLVENCGKGKIFLNDTICYECDNIWSDMLDNNALSSLVECIKGKAENISGIDEHMLVLRPLLEAYLRYRGS